MKPKPLNPDLVQELLDKKAKENNRIDLNAYAQGLSDAHASMKDMLYTNGYCDGFEDGYARAVDYVKRGIPLSPPDPITLVTPPNQLDIFNDSDHK